jgi:tRNA pseudouridine55 synthase
MASGLVLIDKPQGWTSHDVVAKMRGVLGTRKVGHAGTLDPMATGLLILGVDSGTKLLQYLLGKDKTYRATIRLGETTQSDDADSPVEKAIDASSISTLEIDQAIKQLTGEIEQIPSSVSAKKIDGKRAYDLVREGKEVQLKPKSITIHSFERLGEPVVSGQAVEVEVEVRCSSGTYIRALARDIGIELKVGGHLAALRRTDISEFRVSDATTMEQEPVVVPMIEAATGLFSATEITSDQETDLRHGKRIVLDSAASNLAATRDGALIALIESVGSEYKSMAVFEAQA